MSDAKELRDKPTEDLERDLEGLVEGLFKLRFRKVTDVVENPAEFKKSRRQIARIKTILRERGIKR
ncbi:MAG: 50S ribosomal protein L29 [Planctomycetes bacterium]|nr:50S ribosomal protein L29 [Planctomycetota bacterium]